MNIDNWNYYYKINPDTNQMIETNLIYTPLLNPEGTIMCMWFDHTNPYQNEDIAYWLPERPDYTAEMVKFFFDREVEYLTAFKDKPWAPTILKIDYDKQQIFFEWQGTSLNHVIFGGGNLNEYCPDWEAQMAVIIKDIVSSGYYKVSLYPHCYYIVDGVLKTFDFYGCVRASDPYVSLTDIKGMIGETSGPRFAEATEGNKLNISILFKRALGEYVEWPNHALRHLYRYFYCE
jgi:hypothetical protein